MGDEAGKRFAFGDRRHTARDADAGTDARGLPGDFSYGGGTGAYGGHGYGGFGHNLAAEDGEPIRRRIYSALRRDPRVPEAGIDVAVDERRVTLTGVVPSESAKRAVAELVRSIPGVSDVIDRIQVMA